MSEQATKREEAPKWPLDWETTDIQMDLLEDRITHEIRRPTYEELVKREDVLTVETLRLDKHQQEDVDNLEEADSYLWDKIAQTVDGYQLDGRAGKMVVTQEIKEAVPRQHKSTCIQGLYQFKFTVEKGARGLGFDLRGRQVHTLVGTNGPYRLVFRLRHPTETQWAQIEKSGYRVVTEVRDGKAKSIQKTNLPAAVEFFDALFDSCDGVTLEGAEFTQPKREDFRAAIDPIHKQFGSIALFSALKAKLSD